MTPRQEYRNCWNAWRSMQTQEGKRAMEQEMDRLQPMIAPGPGPEWDEFKATLPGYNEFWSAFAENAMSQIEEMKHGHTGGLDPIRSPDPGPPSRLDS